MRTETALAGHRRSGSARFARTHIRASEDFSLKGRSGGDTFRRTLWFINRVLTGRNVSFSCQFCELTFAERALNALILGLRNRFSPRIRLSHAETLCLELLNLARLSDGRLQLIRLSFPCRSTALLRFLLFGVGLCRQGFFWFGWTLCLVVENLAWGEL